MRQTWLNGWRAGKDEAWQVEVVRVPLRPTG